MRSFLPGNPDAYGERLPVRPRFAADEARGLANPKNAADWIRLFEARRMRNAGDQTGSNRFIPCAVLHAVGHPGLDLRSVEGKILCLEYVPPIRYNCKKCTKYATVSRIITKYSQGARKHMLKYAGPARGANVRSDRSPKPLGSRYSGRRSGLGDLARDCASGQGC